MTNHTFDLAAALVDKAVERLADRTYGITRVLFHEFGSFPLCANHTRHDTGHGVKMWAYAADRPVLRVTDLAHGGVVAGEAGLGMR